MQQEACLDTDETQVPGDALLGLQEEVRLAESSGEESKSGEEGFEEESETEDELVQPVDLHDDQVQSMLDQSAEPANAEEDDDATVYCGAGDVKRPTSEDMVRLSLDFHAYQNEAQQEVLKDLEEEKSDFGQEGEDLEEKNLGLTGKEGQKGSVKARVELQLCPEFLA